MIGHPIIIENDAHWHDLRSRHVGGSEVAALFGEHPHLTEFELWHRKKGNLPEPDLSDNERVFWGSVLEPAIANGVARKTGWGVFKVEEYYSALPDLGLGGSLDYMISAPGRGPGVLEVKNVDWLVAKNWEGGQPPLSFMLQIQSYLALTGWTWGCMAPLVGGNELRLFEYERRPTTIKIICSKVANFWSSIAENSPPKPDFGYDLDAIMKLRTVEPGKIIDLTSNSRLHSLIAEYQEYSDRKRESERTIKADKAEICTIIGDADVAICGDYTVRANRRFTISKRESASE
jgi:predicted phage-related endonuclease